MDARDLELRNVTYGRFVELGRAPRSEEIPGWSPSDVALGWRRLHDAHAIVLDPNGEIRMANPFSGVPTAYEVEAAGRRWYANCAWDAFGVCAALHADGRIEASCPDCGEDIVVGVSGGRPDDDALLFHCLVPAESWWEDIFFT